MALALHVVIALTSIAWTGYVFFAPSQSRLELSYTLVALTLATGTYLVWSTHAPLLQACVTGLAYLAVVFSGILAARYRLARASK